MEHWWNDTEEGKRRYCVETLSVCHFVCTKCHRLTRVRTRAHAVPGRQLSTSGMEIGICKMGVLSVTGEKSLVVQVAAFRVGTKLIK